MRLNWSIFNMLDRNQMRTIVACFAMIGLSSCALVKSPEAPRETFEISAPTSFGGILGDSNAQILIKVPTALKAIDSDRMIVKPSPSVITYMAGAQWADTIPKLVQARLVETFENTGRTRATARPGDGLVIDYQLVSDIRRFEVANNRAVIEISIKLLVDKTGLVQETRIFTASSQTSGSTPQDYVLAFDSAFDELSRSIVRWIIRQT